MFPQFPNALSSIKIASCPGSTGETKWIPLSSVPNIVVQVIQHKFLLNFSVLFRFYRMRDPIHCIYHSSFIPVPSEYYFATCPDSIQNHQSSVPKFFNHDKLILYPKIQINKHWISLTLKQNKMSRQDGSDQCSRSEHSIV